MTALRLLKLLVILINCELLQHVHVHAFQRSLVCGFEHHLRYFFIVIARSVLKGFLPAADAEAPATTISETDVAQIVALRSTVVQELVRNYTGDTVVPVIGLGCLTVSRAREAG